MITTTRSEVRAARHVLRAAFGVTVRARGPNVTLAPADDGLVIRATDGQVALEYRLAGESSGEAITVPFGALGACEGRRADLVTIRPEGEQAIVEWMDAGIPQSATFACCKPTSLPGLPANTASNELALLEVLRDAVDTTDRSSTRYALGCVRLRGRDGQVAATDGRQAFLAWGHSFPWQEDILVPGTRFFGAGLKSMTSPVLVGRTDDWLTLACDGWTIWLKIDKEGRFPAIDDHFCSVADATTTLRISDPDANFAVEAVKRLPGHEEYNAPVTDDLNGCVAIRGVASNQATTEVVLGESQRHGAEIRFATNRVYLARALRLGFREVQLQDAALPAICREERRAYVWALLGKESCVRADERTIRIESPSHSSTMNHPRRRTTTMTKTQATSTTQRQHNETASAEATSSALEQAEALRDSLKQSFDLSRQLVASLRKRKKQSRIVRDTLASLRQLQDVA